MAANQDNDHRQDDLSEAQQADESSEQAPLIASEDRDDTQDEEETSRRPSQSAASSSLLRSIQGRSGKGSRWKRWPSLLALLVLCIVAIFILVAAFVAPQIVSEYASQAAKFEPISLSIASFTATGVVAHVQGLFDMDAARVKSKPTRDLGRFGTWLAREIQTQATTVHVTFPEYGNQVVGTAQVPSIKVNVGNGHTTGIDFHTHLEPGSKDNIRRVADDWIKGRLGQLRVQGKADVKVQSGLISLPAQSISQSLVFEGGAIPDMPNIDVRKLHVQDRNLSHGDTGVAASALIDVANDYPVSLEVPPLSFDMLVPGCSPSDEYIMLADADVGALHVKPKQDVAVNVTALIRDLPKEAVKACPGSAQSPLDVLLGNYMHGNDSTIYVRGSKSASEDTPQWIVDLISDITVPVPFPGKSFGHLIKEFKMEHVHFDLPDLFADPDSPDSKPKISAEINALIGLPDEFNLNIDVDRVRSDADVYYKKQKFGELDLREWHHATSRPVKTSKHHSDLLVKADVKKAPLTITDSDIFSEVVQEMLTSTTGVNLTVQANVDVEMETSLGKFIVRQIPAEGNIPVNRMLSEMLKSKISQFVG